MRALFSCVVLLVAATACSSRPDRTHPVAMTTYDWRAAGAEQDEPRRCTEPFDAVVSEPGGVIVDAAVVIAPGQVLRLSRPVHSGCRVQLEPERQASVWLKRVSNGPFVESTTPEGPRKERRYGLSIFPQDVVNDPPLEPGEHVVLTPLFPVPGSEDLPPKGGGVSDVVPGHR